MAHSEGNNQWQWHGSICSGATATALLFFQTQQSSGDDKSANNKLCSGNGTGNIVGGSGKHSWRLHLQNKFKAWRRQQQKQELLLMLMLAAASSEQ